MQWSRIPTNLINGKFEDAEILAIVKYQLIFALYEEIPNEKILSRFLTKKQKNIVKNFVAVIQPNVENEIKSVQEKRKNDKLYYAKNKEKCKISDNLSDNLLDNVPSEQIRLDNIRQEEKEITKEKELDPFSSKEVSDVIQLYKQICTNLIPYTRGSRKSREAIAQFIKDIEFDFMYIQMVFEKANKLKTICNRIIDIQTIINCHERIANDFYKTQEQEEEEIKDPYNPGGYNSAN